MYRTQAVSQASAFNGNAEVTLAAVVVVAGVRIRTDGDRTGRRKHAALHGRAPDGVRSVHTAAVNGNDITLRVQNWKMSTCFGMAFCPFPKQLEGF